MITIHQRYRQTDRQRDRQTDRQTTCDRNTALCTKVHRAVIKTKELIFHNPRVRLYSVRPAILTIDRVTSAKLLGIYVQSNLSCDINVKHIMTVSSQRLHNYIEGS